MTLAFTPILMAKFPELGAVKTRLCGPGAYSPQHAAAISLAMLECTIARLADYAAAHGRPLVLTVTPDDDAGRLRHTCAAAIAGRSIQLEPQGDGDLGERMLRQWRRAAHRPVAFFGADTPDLPLTLLDAVAEGLVCHDLAVGPASDGGYWTLAGHEPAPAVLSDMDWGSGHVYEETAKRAVSSGLACSALPPWRDVDHPEDVDALIDRLRRTLTLAGGDDALRLLYTRLLKLLDRSEASTADSGFE